MGADSLRGKIIEELEKRQGLTDKQLVALLKDWTRSEEAVAMQCRRLEEDGVLRRIKRVGTPTGNYLIEDETAPQVEELAEVVQIKEEDFDIPQGAIHLPELLKIGFRQAGDWFGSERQITFNSNELGETSNVLFAFVIDGTVVYLSKTQRSLNHVLMMLQSNQGTEFQQKIHRFLKNLLTRGREISIYALPDPGTLQYAGHKISLTAGLEPALIDYFSPMWNMKDDAA